MSLINPLRFLNGFSEPVSFNYEDSCEQREEDERLGEWLFAAKQSHFTVVGAGLVPLERCGQCVPKA